LKWLAVACLPVSLPLAVFDYSVAGVDVQEFFGDFRLQISDWGRGEN
jgi:hypothetical protein